MVEVLGFLMVSYDLQSCLGRIELMGSSDFYESTAKYHSSAVKAIVSPKVDEAEAGAVTTTMVVSFAFSGLTESKLTDTRRKHLNLSRTHSRTLMPHLRKRQ